MLNIRTRPRLTTQEARGNDRPAIPATHFSAAIGTLSLLTSVASFILVLQGAIAEPYAEFNPSDALSQIGLGFLLIGI